MAGPPQGPNTIVLRGELGEKYEEGIASGVVTPGDLIFLDSTGQYKDHATAGGRCERLVATEWFFTGDTTVAGKGGTIDDAYQIGDIVRFHICQAGDVCYMRLAAGNNAAVGADLASNGDGKLKVGNGTTDVALFKAATAADGTSAVVRVRARAL